MSISDFSLTVYKVRSSLSRLLSDIKLGLTGQSRPSPLKSYTDAMDFMSKSLIDSYNDLEESLKDMDDVFKSYSKRSHKSNK